jgi:carbohydrate-selective porin OprB
MFRNSPTIETPDNSAGIYANLEVNEYAALDLVAMEADGDWEDIGDDAFGAVQLNIKPNLLERPGNYRVYAWINSNDHTDWANSTLDEEEGYGVGISLDQELTDILGVFGRYGWQDPAVYLTGNSYSLEHAYSAGVRILGTSWNREEDVLGCAFGQIFPSGDYKDANSSYKADPEGHFEAYYSFKVNDHLTISPDIHVIWDPYGGDASNGDKTIVVGGARTQVDF